MSVRLDRRRFVRWGLSAGAALAGARLTPASAGIARAEEQWVQSLSPTVLWSSPGPGEVSFGPVRRLSYFRVHGPRVGDRLYVYNPRTQNFAYIDAKAVGPSTPPPPEYLRGPRVRETLGVPARASGTVSIWREPLADDDVWSHEVPHNSILMVKDAVEGQDGERWYRLEDSTFVQVDQVRVPPPAESHDAQDGRWIDVSLIEPVIVTAFEGGRTVYSALAVHGVGGWETPLGTFVIQRRVANERMRGPGYDVSNVLFTQYFTDAGHSLHYNYWSSNWGYAGSHGCLGMTYEDALWFWEWATIDVPVIINA